MIDVGVGFMRTFLLINKLMSQYVFPDLEGPATIMEKGCSKTNWLQTSSFVPNIPGNISDASEKAGGGWRFFT